MDMIRIGDKIIDVSKIHRKIDMIIELREKGNSQQEVADLLGIHRTFISRLESLGEIRKGKSIALIGFPLKNKEEIETLCEKYGIEFKIIMTDKERWHFIKSKSGIQLFNSILEIISELRKYDIIISLASDKRNKLLETLVDKEVICIDLGESPLINDMDFDITKLEEIFKTIKDRRKKHEKDS